MANEKRQYPADVETLKLLVTTIIEKSMPQMKLRDKEWCLRELERLRKVQRLDGGRRHIKATGVVRAVDDLGRVVIPKELRRTLNLAAGDAVEISVDAENGWVVLESYVVSCAFCGNTEDLNNLMGRAICENCVAKVARGEFVTE